MKRILALAPTALLLAACGDTCSSAAAPVQSVPSSCSVAAGASSTIQVQLCPHCTDSAPSCQAEFRNGQIEVAPTFQQCKEQSGCPVDPSCGIQNNTASCSVSVPSSASGAIPIIDASTGSQIGTASVGSGSCG
jgi:hypothetical protein